MNTLRAGALLLAALAAASTARAASVTVETSVLSAKATVGDEIRVFARVEHPKDVTVEPPSPKSAVAPFELKRVEVAPFATGKNRVRETFVLVLTSFEPGNLTVPPVEISYEEPTGRRGTVRTDPVSIEIVAVTKEGDNKLKPIKGPLHVQGGLRDALLGALAALLTAVLIFRLWWLHRNRRAVDPEALLPPHERVKRELGRLERSNWLAAGKEKEHYSELADVLRRYLERRFALAAEDLTTNEILSHLKQLEITKENVELAREALETADLVKFAKFSPDSNTHTRVRRAIEDFAMATRPAEPEKAAKP